jgi:hypothetical protein
MYGGEQRSKTAICSSLTSVAQALSTKAGGESERMQLQINQNEAIK